MFKNKGHRIRAGDKHLVVTTYSSIAIGLFLLLFFGVYGKSILNQKFDAIVLTDKSLLVAPSFYIFLFAWLVIVLFLFYWLRFKQIDFYKQLLHRQKMAQMILENRWYESESVSVEGFFKDLSPSKQKERILYFPKIYYRVENGLIHILVEIRMGQYQDQLLKLEKKLESGLYCELVDKELKEGFVEYVLFYDMIANRLSIEECESKPGALQLMKNIWWEYDQLPHMLIAGGTGGGKSVTRSQLKRLCTVA